MFFYTYNANGIRTSKTVDGVRHDFVLDGAKILRETWGNNTLTPLYDNEDSVCGIIYNNVPYYFQKNLQGDIIGIVDKDSTVVARYSYDAWGKVRSVKNSNNDEITSESHIAIINPFRYRGYYFDQGTNLYYLQSRYYDAEVGRFINGDKVEIATVADNPLLQNLFLYCCNDCINQNDDLGYGGIEVLLKILNASIDVLTKLIDMIGNSCIKERKKLENSVRLLTRKERKKLKGIKELQSETSSVSKKLGWVGIGITFLTIIIVVSASYETSKNLTHAIVEFAIETFVALIELGAGEVFEWIARFIPYVGCLIGIFAGWMISYLLSKYFNKKRVERIKSRFSSLVKNKKISLPFWTKSAIKSLSA